MKRARAKENLEEVHQAAKNSLGSEDEKKAYDLGVEKACELTESGELKLIKTFDPNSKFNLRLTEADVAAMLYELLLRGKIDVTMANSVKGKFIGGASSARPSCKAKPAKAAANNAD